MTTAEHEENTTYLATKNPHPRDRHIHFDEGPHKYTIEGIEGILPETEFTSVTTWVHQHFEHFDAKKVIAGMMRNQKKWNDPISNAKYYGKTAEEIEEMWEKSGQDAAMAGTEMHYKIECFYNNPSTNDHHPDHHPDHPSKELEYFMNFHRDFSKILRPYRTEWTVFHEEARIAGSIDMVYELTTEPLAPSSLQSPEVPGPGVDVDVEVEDVVSPPRGTSLVIYDWKRCREIIKTNRANKYATHPIIEHLPDTNYWHYALQLNIYKYILEAKYDKTITDLYIIVLHPDAQNYQRIKLPNLQTEVAELFEERIKKHKEEKQ